MFDDYMNQCVFRSAGMKESYLLDDKPKRVASDSLHNGASETIFGKHWNTSGEEGQISSLQDFYLFRAGITRTNLHSGNSRKARRAGKN